jgi:prepilin-type N-terminal cleavage/methylation domain-containing protein/prepilin-type processing-associated H-X9-DG protein
MKSRRTAFTLIELLVVLTVISILAGLLLPVLARTRENGRRAACQSNLRQIGLGLQQYSQDWDEVLVPDWFAPDGTTDPGKTQAASTPGAEYKWMDAIFPYVRDEQVYTCPSATGSRAIPYKYYGNMAPGTSTDAYGSYVIMHGYGPTDSAKVDGCDDCTPPVSHPLSHDRVPLSRVGSAATTAWVMDGEIILNGDSTFYAKYADGTIQPIDNRHLDTINVLYLDGHVKAVREDILTRRNANGVISAATIQDD